MTEPNSPQPTVSEITAQQFATWRRHPAGALHLRFLETLRTKYVEHAVSAFLAGTLLSPEEAEARGRIKMLDDLIGMDWAALVGVLGPDQQPDDADKPNDGDDDAA